MHKYIGIGLLALFAGFSSANQRSVTLVTHDSFNLSKEVVAEFEARQNIKIAVIKGGDAGAMTNRLILTKQNPIADVVYGIDNTLLARALAADILAPYRPKVANLLEKNLLLDAKWRISPVNYGYVALNYDIAWFAAKKLPLPKTLEDFLKPEYKGMLVVQNPATSSPGLAFLLATIKHFGEQKALAWWAALGRNDLKIASGWESAYYSDFSRNGGSRPVVVSYASSPAAEVFYGDGKTAPTANLLLAGSSFLQIEGVAVLKGAKNPELAQKVVDFLLEPQTQKDIPTQMWVYPVRRDVALPEVFAFAEKPSKSSNFAPSTIAANEKRWVQAWTKVVLGR
ncbi:MAG: thiamine ABC transporter substrate binding subunit [Deinococcales bacterium]